MSKLTARHYIKKHGA